MLYQNEMVTQRCEAVKEQLGRWYDGELAAADAAQVAVHVAVCPSCKADVAGWRRIDRLLAHQCEVGTEQFEASVMAALRRQRQDARAQGWWLRLAGAVVLAAALGGLGGWTASLDRQRRLQDASRSTSLALVEKSFAPESLAGFDTLAADLGAQLPERPR